jgi:hypothetical protein
LISKVSTQQGGEEEVARRLRITSVRAESFLEDQLYIGQLAGVQLEHVESHHSSGGSNRDLARQYFGELDRRTVDRLYALYQVDFEMFGYSPNLYLSYARPTP